MTIDASTAKSLAFWGEHLIVGLSGIELGAEEAEMLRELRPLGIVLFAKNIDRSELESAPSRWIERLEKLIADARAAIGRDELLVSIDHEGGRVHRLPLPVTRFPAAAHWSESAAEVALAMARELRAIGVTLTYSPVLDVFSEPQNTVIGPRAFVGDPEAVAEQGVRFIAALSEGQILSCGKHFPGHGATVSDSHFELPYLDASRETLEKRELVPFVAAIKAGVPLIMTAHVVYRALDPNNPATLSPLIVDGLLRSKLGFSGAVITDDLEMHAISNLGPAQIALRAIGAGVDILLEANPKDVPAAAVGLKMAAALREGFERGELEEVRILRSRERIARLLRTHRAMLARSGSLAHVGSAEHVALASRLAPPTTA